jgi:hypothetical protein
MPTTIFTPTNPVTSEAGGFTAWTFKNDCAITANGQGQIRVTFKAGPSGNFVVTHCGLAIITPGSGPASGTVSELLFSTVAGFSIAANSTIVSDWLNFACTASDRLMVSFETAGTNATVATSGTNGAQINGSYLPGVSPAWNSGSAAGYSTNAQTDYAINLIETQAGGGGAGGAGGVPPLTFTQSPILQVRERIIAY